MDRSEALGPDIYLCLVLWKISTCVFWQWSVVSANAIKEYIFACVLHGTALSNWRPRPVQLLYLSAGRRRLGAALMIAGRNPVLFLLWNHVLLSELQVWMQNKSDFLKSLIFFFLLYDSCVFRAKLFEVFTETQMCGFMPRRRKHVPLLFWSLWGSWWGQELLIYHEPLFRLLTFLWTFPFLSEAVE